MPHQRRPKHRPRERPEYLADKLLRIRTKRFKVSQSKMLTLIGEDNKLPARVSEWERGVREPDLITLLGYSRAAKLHMEMLVDDRLKLPSKFD